MSTQHQAYFKATTQVIIETQLFIEIYQNYHSTIDHHKFYEDFYLKNIMFAVRTIIKFTNSLLK